VQMSGRPFTHKRLFFLGVSTRMEDLWLYNHAQHTKELDKESMRKCKIIFPAGDPVANRWFLCPFACEEGNLRLLIAPSLGAFLLHTRTINSPEGWRKATTAVVCRCWAAEPNLSTTDSAPSSSRAGKDDL